MRVGRWIGAAIIAVLAVVTLDPARFGLEQTDGVAQLIGLRGLLACGLASLAAACVLVAARWHERAGVVRPAAVLATVLVVVALGHLAVLGSRGLDPGEPPTAASEGPDDLTLMTINVRSGAADADAIVAAVVRTGIDVLAVTEASAWYQTRIERRLERAGLDFVQFTGEGTGSPPRGSVLYISADLGTYVGVPTPYVGVVRVEAADGVGPPFAVMHPVSLPIFPFGPAAAAKTERWRSDLEVVSEVAADMPGGVIAGDLNATVDHLSLDDVAGYADVGAAAGLGGFGTIPRWLPGWMGGAIDHVLIDPSALEMLDAAVVEVAGTDHRAVLVRLARARPGDASIGVGDR